MSNKLKSKGFRWLSSILVCVLIFQTVPISGLSTVFAEKNQTEKVKNASEKQYRQNGRQEIVSKRTENSKTYLNANGTFTTEISQKPIHFKNNHNKWEMVANELVENHMEQVYENKANNFKVKFKKENIPNAPFLTVEDEQSSVELQLGPLEHTNEKPAAVQGIVEGESITYPGVFSDIDMKYTVGSDRIKEDIIYNKKPSKGFPEQFTYKMDLDELKVIENGGTIYLYDEESNKPLYYLDSPYMYDSYEPEGFKVSSGIKSIPEEAMSFDVQLTHEVKNNQLYLHVIPNKDWLEDASRIYPITIDPTIVRFQSSRYVEDTSLRSAYPAQTGGNDLELGGGTASSNTLRSLLKFDFSSIPSDTTILSSSLNLWFSSTNGSTPANLSVYKVTKQWAENQASWNYAKTIPSTAWNTAGGDYETAKLATVSGITSPTSLDNDFKKWEVPTSVIQGWKDSPNTNYGFLLKSESETTNVYKKFISSEHTVDSKYHPLMVVTYKTNARLGLEDYGYMTLIH